MTGFIVIGKIRHILEVLKVLTQLEREMPHLMGTLDGKVIRLIEQCSEYGHTKEVKNENQVQ